MGQTVLGIMYGCRLPDPPRRCEDDLDIYTDRAVDRANMYEGGGVERDAGLVGLWVAVGGSGIEHAARLDYVCVEFADKALRAHPEIGPFVRDAVRVSEYAAPDGWVAAETFGVVQALGVSRGATKRRADVLWKLDGYR